MGWGSGVGALRVIAQLVYALANLINGLIAQFRNISTFELRMLE